jgi:hypothetical protein
LRIAAKRGHKRAVVAMARKLVVIMHRMWLDDSECRFTAADGSHRSKQENGARRRMLELRRAPSRGRFDGRKWVWVPPRAVLPRDPEIDMCVRTAHGAEQELLHGPLGVLFQRKRIRSRVVDRRRELV